jgi:hypothetical protein
VFCNQSNSSVVDRTSIAFLEFGDWLSFLDWSQPFQSTNKETRFFSHQKEQHPIVICAYISFHADFECLPLQHQAWQVSL